MEDNKDFDNEGYEFEAHEYQVNKENGDIDFVTVYDLPKSVSLKWVTKQYPNCKISLYKTYSKQ